eukprot:jgi/Ulvmu1/11694/UM008_0104.1
MSRSLSETEIAGLPAWGWTLIWFGAGFFAGSVTVGVINCWWRREVQASRCPYPPSRAYMASRQLPPRRGSPGSSEQLSKSDVLKNALTGNIADSANIVDSVSISHWRNGHGLHPVSETDPGCSASGAYSPTSKSGRSGLTCSAGLPALLPPLSNSGNISAHLGAADLCGPTVNSNGDSGPIVQAAPGAAALAAARRRNNNIGGAPGHERTASAVSSIGPSAEYDEEELDDDWKTLLEEVNTLLTSKQKEPIRDAKERATVVNSLLVSTSTRSRDDCVRNAAIDMLTFRKMSEQPGVGRR